MSEQLLEKILAELKGTRSEMQEIRSELKETRSEMHETRSEMKSRFDTLETKVSIVQQDVSQIKESVQRIEENEPADVLAILDRIDRKLEEKGSEITVLNNRLFKVESTTERLTKQ